MGLFDFFKKKRVLESEPKPTTEESTAENVDTVLPQKSNRGQIINIFSQFNLKTEHLELKKNQFVKDLIETNDDYAYVEDINCCEKCAPYVNRYYSISGKDNRFPKLPDFFFNLENINCCGLVPTLKSKVIIDTFIQTKNRGDIIEISNRPFVDDRTKADIIAHNYYKFVADINKKVQNGGRYSFDFDSGLTENGEYDFTMLTNDEKNYIQYTIDYISEMYDEQYRAIALSEKNQFSVLKPSYILSSYIALKYENSENPLDVLATAITYERKGALYRKKAIEYYEKYFDNPVSLKKPNSDASFYYEDNLHKNLALLYEKEYRFDEALSEYKKALKSRDLFASDIINIGDILTKIDINSAVEHYQEYLSSDKIDDDTKQYINSSYQKALEKRQKGYVYKPRKSKPKPEDEIINIQIEELARQFI